jgi:hypothetical protein
MLKYFSIFCNIAKTIWDIKKDMKCALVGDFNAKTAVLEDFSEPDETFLNVMDVNVEDDLFRYCYDHQVLLDNNISFKRYTQCECRPNILDENF